LKGVLLFLTLIVLSGCGNKEEIPNKYLYTVAWNDIIYGLTNETVPQNKLGNVIGEISSEGVRNPLPNKNGGIGCSVPECKAPPMVSGSKLREINGVDQHKAIAVETRGNDGYYKLEYYRELE
jgi:hypothetical protein